MQTFFEFIDESMKLQRIVFLLAAIWLSNPVQHARSGSAQSAAPAEAPSLPKPAPKSGAVAYDPTKPATAPVPEVPKAVDVKPIDDKTGGTKPVGAEIQIPAATAVPFKRIGPVPVPSKTKSFIWEVKSPTNVVYLFGTIHVGKRAFYPLPEQVETAFDNATKLVVEADVSDQSAAGDVSELISYKSPDTLDRHIPLPLFERLKTQLLRLRMPVSAVLPMKPFVVGGFLSVVEFSRLGYDMNLGVDAYLISRAKHAGKVIVELESARAQLELLNNMPADLQEAFLDNAITTLETEKVADQVTGMVNAWQTGDTKLMADVTLEVNKGSRSGSRLDDILLYGRHDAMVKKIEGYLAGKEPHFVAVGSLHLVGPRGLVQVLKGKGYEVTQQ